MNAGPPYPMPSPPPPAQDPVGGLRTAVLFAATLVTGLLAGIFTDWSNAVMPGLAEVDDRTFVQSFQALDRAITNPLFLGVGFVGALLLIVLALLLHLAPAGRPVLPWLGVALACYLLVQVITIGVHEPLNQQLRAAGTPDGVAELAAARAALEEARWTAWNTVRAFASLLTFALLAWALVIHRRPGRAARRTG